MSMTLCLLRVFSVSFAPVPAEPGQALATAKSGETATDSLARMEASPGLARRDKDL